MADGKVLIHDLVRKKNIRMNRKLAEAFVKMKRAVYVMDPPAHEDVPLAQPAEPVKKSVAVKDAESAIEPKKRGPKKKETAEKREDQDVDLTADDDIDLTSDDEDETVETNEDEDEDEKEESKPVDNKRGTYQTKVLVADKPE